MGWKANPRHDFLDGREIQIFLYNFSNGGECDEEEEEEEVEEDLIFLLGGEQGAAAGGVREELGEFA